MANASLSKNPDALILSGETPLPPVDSEPHSCPRLVTWPSGDGGVAGGAGTTPDTWDFQQQKWTDPGQPTKMGGFTLWCMSK